MFEARYKKDNTMYTIYDTKDNITGVWFLIYINNDFKWVQASEFKEPDSLLKQVGYEFYCLREFLNARM